MVRKVYAVLGDPVAHSLSPIMHTAAFARLGMDALYLAFQVSQEQLGAAIRGAQSLGFGGLNLTIPLKEAALQYVEPEAVAEQIGAVNTVDFATGQAVGYNTDGLGSLQALKETVGDLTGRTVLILGAGGAAKAIAFYLDAAGAMVRLANRNKARAEELAQRLKNAAAIGLGTELARQLEAADILINATSVGMHPRVDETLVTAEMMRPDLVVFDIVYNPLETRLLKEARRAGVKTCISGVKMLVYQGAASFKLWTAREPPIKVMERAVIDALRHEWLRPDEMKELRRGAERSRVKLRQLRACSVCGRGVYPDEITVREGKVYCPECYERERILEKLKSRMDYCSLCGRKFEPGGEMINTIKGTGEFAHDSCIKKQGLEGD
jgi:shikimate dehydrogenase